MDIREILGRTNNFWIKIGDRMLCVPAKNGSMSFRCSVMPELRSFNGSVGGEFIRLAEERGIGLFTPERAASFGLPMFISVRHPVERFASLWRDLQRRGVRTLKAIQYVSPEGLMDVIEKYPEQNDHWTRQASYWHESATCIRYDRFLKTLGLPFEWRHKSDKKPVEVPVQRIETFYARDVELWQNACRSR